MYFYVLLYYCHRANTQLQLSKYIYIFFAETVGHNELHVVDGLYMADVNQN
jgi:hypothetical protein